MNFIVVGLKANLVKYTNTVYIHKYTLDLRTCVIYLIICLDYHEMCRIKASIISLPIIILLYTNGRQEEWKITEIPSNYWLRQVLPAMHLI